MTKLALAVLVAGLGFGGAAQAGPTARLGITGAVTDEGAPGKYEVGPLIAVGMRAGRFVGELEWSYLSFFDPDTTGGGVQRLGVSLRTAWLADQRARELFRERWERVVADGA